MYESPIDIIYNDIQYKVVEEFDKNVVSAVQSYRIDVNKEELLKALRYDRQQYEKGYADAKEEYLPRWIPCSERLPEHGQAVLVALDGGSMTDGVRSADHAGRSVWDCALDNRTWYGDENIVIAWMPLPEAFKEGEK